MPYLAEHFHVLQPSERLGFHNIGFKNNFRGLFLAYNRTLTCFNPDHSIKWQITATGNIIDFCIDQKSKLLFYTTSGSVYALSLESGSQLWTASKDYSFTSTSITCSPKNKLVFCSQISGSYQYIYIFNYSGGRVNSVYKGVNRVRYLDKSDRLITDDTYSISSLTKEISGAVSIATVSGTGFRPSTVSKKDPDKVYVYANSTVYLSMGKPIAPVGLTQISSVYLYSAQPTDTVEDDFIYFSDYNGNYQYVVKVDLKTGQQIYRKQVRSATTTIPTQSITQDASHLYQVGNPDKTENKILVIDKVTGDIVNRLSLNPDATTLASNLKLLHTYDSLT